MDRTELGLRILAVSLLVFLAYWIVYGVVNVSGWCVLAVFPFAGLVLIWWDAFD